MENLNEKMLKTLKEFGEKGKKASLLLHSCCAVCAASALPRLFELCDVTCFYYNPNILDGEEYVKRYEALEKLITRFNSDNGCAVALMQGDWEYSAYLEAVRGKERLLEGDIRCADCFELRLSKTAQVAKRKNYDFFATTLTLSPHKNAQLLNIIGKNCGEQYGCRYLPTDLKKNGGVLLSAKLCEEYGIYRQNYCGCGFPLEN